MVHPEYLDFTEHVKSHFFCHVKRWPASNEWEGGNKWFKLRYNWMQAQEKGYDSIVSVGGAWSNHLCALAYAGQQMGWKTIGLVRGAWRLDQPTASMEEMKERGMQLVGLDTSIYEIRDTEDFKVWLRDQYPNAYYIPEGGANYWGLMGAMEMLNERDKEDYDDIWIAGGTGTTAAGVLLSAASHQKIHVVFALKAPLKELRAMILSKLSWLISDQEELNALMERVMVYSDVYFGGYGKANDNLFEWINQWNELGLPLDRVYTAKLWWHLKQQDARGLLQRRTLVIHTGGLQSNRSIISV
jgi:1-aminocyclopropane-1-carboxylate deaminase